MSTTSVKPIETLKGVFNVPKMNSRRNFLRENKLSLRELQRVTNKKQLAKELQLEQQQNMYLGRRCVSQQRSVAEQPQISASSRCPSCSRIGGGGVDSSSGRRRVPNGSIATGISMISKTASCDKEIQTEDIHDEDFLYNALKKCASNECQSVANSVDCHNGLQRQSNSDTNMGSTRRSHQSLQQALEFEQNSQQQSSYPAQMEVEPLAIGDAQEQNSTRLQPHSQHQHYQQSYNGDHYHQPSHNALEFNREPAYSMTNGLNDLDGTASIAARSMEQETHRLQYQSHQDDLKSNFEHLTLQSNCGTREAPLSARSRRTNCTQHSLELTKKRSTGSVHKMGNRDDVRLPRYLEREKRDREEQRQREMERDSNCPLGHYSLSEDERQIALATAERKFKALINELNHMPMTTETLRIRNRKAEIEKELKVLEVDIRIFSKPKVYMKQGD